MESLRFRPETPADFRRVEELVRDAFWDVYAPGCSEHLVLHRLRESPAYLPEISFLAERDGEILGHVAWSKGVVKGPEGKTTGVLTFGPIAVAPACHGQGIGTALLNKTLPLAAATGVPCVVIYGNPAYYGRFGFEDAAKWGITTRDGDNFPAFQVLPLGANGREIPPGTFWEDDVFFPDPAEVDAFDAHFPPREKHVLPGQLK